MKTLSWTEYGTKLEVLAGKVKQNPFSKKADCIIALSRGGLGVGLVLSHQLALPLYTINPQHSIEEVTAELEKLPLADYDFNLNIIVADDISDSGNTLTTIIEAIDLFHTHHSTALIKAITVTLHSKPETSFIPTIYLDEVTEWIKYPYEVDIYKR